MTSNISDATPRRSYPIGTQVVVRADCFDADGQITYLAGTVGSIMRAPDDAHGRYLVRLVNGIEAAFPHDQLAIRRLVTTRDIMGLGAEIMTEVDLYPFVIYRCIVGSRAYGLSNEASDTDRRGFYLPHSDLHWSLFGVPEQLENRESDECYWELEKFIQLALRANPNILECLYTPLVEHVTPLAQELLGQREMFLTRQVYQTYNGYVLSQFKKIEQDWRRPDGEIRWKHAMHLIRLLLSGIKILQEGFVCLAVDGQRERLLSIRRGELTWEQIDSWRLALHREFDEAYRVCHLPDHPDYRKANDFLIRARRSMVKLHD